MSKTTGIVIDLRREIRRAERGGQTRYAIAKATGLSQAMLSRFMSGGSIPKLDTAERVARAIGRKLILASE